MEQSDVENAKLSTEIAKTQEEINELKRNLSTDGRRMTRIELALYLRNVARKVHADAIQEGHTK